MPTMCEWRHHLWLPYVFLVLMFDNSDHVSVTLATHIHSALEVTFVYELKV